MKIPSKNLRQRVVSRERLPNWYAVAFPKAMFDRQDLPIVDLVRGFVGVLVAEAHCELQTADPKSQM